MFQVDAFATRLFTGNPAAVVCTFNDMAVLGGPMTVRDLSHNIELITRLDRRGLIVTSL